MPYYGGGGGGSGANPGGADGAVQFALAGAFAGDTGLVYDPVAKALRVNLATIATPVPGNESVVLGQNLEATVGNSVLVGRNMAISVANAIVITNGGAPPAQQDCVVIGRPSLACGQRAVHVGRLGGASGQNGASYGYDAQCTHQDAMALGYKARSSANNRATFGAPTNPMDVEATRDVHAAGAVISGQASSPASKLATNQFALWLDGTVLRIVARAADGLPWYGEIPLTDTLVGPPPAP